MTAELRVSAWILPALFVLPLLLLHLFWYIRLYRFRANTVFGLDFTWWYSYPRGRVSRVRAFCPHCRKRAPEPTFFLDQYDNYLCRNCGYNTDSRRAERIEYPWRAAVQRRVYARLYKPPGA
jgi:ribosomal protein S27AE